MLIEQWANQDEITEQFRQMMMVKVPIAQETDEAEACLSALSFQSTTYPERHLWIDTDLEGEISLDLEDRNIAGEWDNAIARITVESLTQAVKSAHAWLSGVNLDKLWLSREL